MTIAERVSLLLQASDLRKAHAPQVACALRMSSTTLHRRLKHEGTSFINLLKAERMRRVSAMPRAYGKQLADVCGYAELNSFYRAYRHWTGRGWLNTRMKAGAG